MLHRLTFFPFLGYYSNVFINVYGVIDALISDKVVLASTNIISRAF